MTLTPRNRGARRRCLWVTNTPTPYRTHLFGALRSEFEQRGVDFSVTFMAETEPWRSWPAEPMPFSHRIATGVHPRLRSGVMHLNPRVPFDVLVSPPDRLILGGAWCMPTVLLSLQSAQLRTGCKVALWSEANSYSIEHSDGLVGQVRRHVFRRVESFIVPGRIARQTIEALRGPRAARFMMLPNLVDESRFRTRVDELRSHRDELRTRLQLPRGHRVLLWSARLEERTKNILGFLRSVLGHFADDVTILIAGGDGDDSKEIRSFVAHELPGRIRLLGHCDTDRMLELFALSDAALLPSMRDANPLSVVEALWAGLPLLISNHCGNAPEAVSMDENGWLLDPTEPSSMREGFTSLLACSRDRLAAMGASSRRIAEAHFSTPRAVAAFADEFEAW